MIKIYKFCRQNQNSIVEQTTGNDNKQVIEYKLNLESNPEFTGSVLVAFARAIGRMANNKNWGCKTVFDIAPVDLVAKPREELIAHLL